MNNKVVNITILVLLVVFILFRVNTALKQMNSKEEQISQSIENLPAVFSGILPCADCPGIESIVVLNEESFEELSHYQDRGNNLYQVDGTWTLTGDTLKLYRVEDELHKAFVYSREQIKLLDRDLQPITGDLEENYTLDRSPEQESIRSRHSELQDEGVDFLANGNEPFWSVQINFDGQLVYQTPGSETPYPFSEFEEIVEDQKTMYSADNMQITIIPGYCRDSMSGFLFTHKVEIQTKGQDMTGCGRYL
ncbi:copper resistance protein NlpE N-terminal domain-containing protein [Rhodohalobacter sp.]|uniref:copper resistance protein NlpE N-terminal domain-containing protein n=2 Tax=Rhodohalobacter sp. TaxID=1974210 RepID=UPI003569A2B7